METNVAGHSQYQKHPAELPQEWNVALFDLHGA